MSMWHVRQIIDFAQEQNTSLSPKAIKGIKETFYYVSMPAYSKERLAEIFLSIPSQYKNRNTSSQNWNTQSSIKNQR